MENKIDVKETIKLDWKEVLNKFLGNGHIEQSEVENMTEEEITEILEKENKELTESYKLLSAGKINIIVQSWVEKLKGLTNSHAQKEVSKEEPNKSYRRRTGRANDYGLIQ